MVSTIILDGYIDEPTCLGVPPYISPYPRYIAGAIWTIEPSASVKYYTIDQVRNNHDLLPTFNRSDIVIIIAGISVPGRYLGGYPASMGELTRFFRHINQPLKLLCGPAARYGFGVGGGKKTQQLQNTIFDLTISGDPEIVIGDFFKHHENLDAINGTQKRTRASDIRMWAVNGAKIIKQHPNYPNRLLAEIETYRGCPRSIIGGCSFCSEPLKGSPDFRDQRDIHHEIKSLYDAGIRHIRLGNQPCIFSYKAHHATKDAVPKPNPLELKKLFVGIRSIAPELKTIHIDNANPGVLAKFPEESRQIAQIIVDNHTPGDVAALGVESVDPIVIEENNLKASSDQVLTAVQVINEIGRLRGKNGMPELLPGLNFLFGLKGETKKTFQMNFNFLKSLIHKNLLLRRINIRQVIPIPGTSMGKIGTKITKKHHKDFIQFKRQVQEEIARPLLKQLVPEGTILHGIIFEKYDGNLTFGRQMGSYPLLVGIPGRYPLGQECSIRVISYGFRSITGLPVPIYINTASRTVLEAIPLIGKKRASHILLNRPFHTSKEFIASFDDQSLAKKLLLFISFENNINEKIK